MNGRQVNDRLRVGSSIAIIMIQVLDHNVTQSGFASTFMGL